jgi:hypothetical protein
MKIIESFYEFNSINEGFYDVYKNRENLPQINSFAEAEQLIADNIFNFTYKEYLINIDMERLTMGIMKPTPKAKYSPFKYVQNYRYGKKERLLKSLSDFIEREESFIKRKDEEKALKKQRREDLKNPFVIGDILYDSWGYEQTNIDFFQVTNVTDKSVYLRPIASEIVSGTEGRDSANVKPVKDKFIGEEIRKPLVVTTWSETPRISSRHGGLSPYTYGDKGVYSSWGY